MTPEERTKEFWKRVDEAERDFGVMLGVFVDEDGEPELSALALDEWRDPKELH